jgi:lactoylglutathione lyase
MGLQVKLVTITVNDPAKALEFYRDKLGWQVMTDQPDGQGGRWLELQPSGGGSTRVVVYPPVRGARAGGFSNVLFASSDVKRDYAELQSRGVQITAPLEEQPWGTFFQWADPDGNEFLVSNNTA